MLDPVLRMATINAVDRLLRSKTYEELNDSTTALLRHFSSYPGTASLLEDFWYSEHPQAARPAGTRPVVILLHDAVHGTGGLVDNLALREFPHGRGSLLERLYSLLHFSRARFAELSRAYGYGKSDTNALQSELRNIRACLVRSVVGKKFLARTKDIERYFDFCSQLVKMRQDCLNECIGSFSLTLQYDDISTWDRTVSIVTHARRLQYLLNSHEVVSESHKTMILWVFQVLVAAIGRLPTPSHIEDAWRQVIITISYVRGGDVLAQLFDTIYAVAPLYLWKAHHQGLLTWRLLPSVVSVSALEDDSMDEDE